MFARKTIYEARKYRDFEEILYDITEFCKEPKRKTWIMYECNLGFQQVEQYLEIAKERNFIQSVGKGKFYQQTRNKGRLYTLTEKAIYNLFVTGGEKDPYIDPNLKELVKKTLSSLHSLILSIERRERDLSIVPEKRTDNFYKNRKRRNKLSIIEDILTKAIKPSFKTRIMYQCNLSFSQLIKYLEGLLENNMIKKLYPQPKHKKSRNRKFETSSKGKVYLGLHALRIHMLLNKEEKDVFGNKQLTDKIESILNPLFLEIEEDALLIPPEEVKVFE